MKCNVKLFLSLMLVVAMVLCSVPLQAIAADSTSLPNATVTVMERITLAAGEYKVWDGSLKDGTIDRPLQAVMNFKANDTVEEALAGGYSDWICDFYLSFNGMETDSISGDGSYLAGNYGSYGWIAVPTDGITVEKGVEYPVVAAHDANLTYEEICEDVKNFTAALYINPETLLANPDMTVTLKLRMTNPENSDDYIIIGDPAVYTAPELYGVNKPDAKVTVMDPTTLTGGTYKVWNGSLIDGTADLPLQAVMNFEAMDTVAEAKLGGYDKWICDFYLTFDGMETDSISGDGSYLAGSYGSYGWIAVPTDGVTVEKGVEYPVVAAHDANLTYKEICENVKNFTAALYVNPKTLIANTDMTVTLKLRMTNPDNPDDYMIIGEPAVYTAPQLYGEKWPKAEITVKDPVTLAPGEYRVYDGTTNLPSGTTDLPLQAVMNFKALETKEEAKLGGFGKWLCDFYLTFNSAFVADDCYLAGNYGSFGWIAIPTDGIAVEKGVRYPVVTNYDPTLNYEDICGSVKDFTAAIYIAPEILLQNPDLTVTLSLQMTDPNNENNIITIDKEAVFTADELLAACGYVAKNTKTDKLYTDVNVANSEAQAGETVILLTNVEVKTLIVYETLDLNGYTLTATHATSFGDIVDNSDSNAGLLKVSKNTFFIQADNAQLPVNTPDGYQFVEVIGFNYRYLDAKQQYVCQPLFEEYAHDLLLAGYDVSGVSIQINVSWVNSNGEPRSQNFTYNSESFLNGYINSYKPETGKYGKMFTLKLNDITKDLTYQIQVVSERGVILASESTTVEKPEENTTTENITINTNAEANQASALVPQGTKLENDATADSLKLTISELDDSQSNITLSENEVQKSVDVHIEGVSKDNTVPMIITVTEFAEKGLNEGNLKLYHVENGKTVAMTQVFTLAEVDAHNEFYYDPATGDITMALATFSEVALVSNTVNAWNGNFDYTWYENAVMPLNDENTADYTIANADQLAAFGAIVGGMNGQTQNSFTGKTVKLLSDVNLGDKDNANESLIFHPIGYYYTDDSNADGTTGDYDSTVCSFEGTFDGDGHTISNFYQNTWEIKGDYDGNYYKDGMGLFGYALNATVENLTVDNFSSDGEFTPTGVIAAYAVNSTFKNIAITNCNPRVYNTGNGGIVGIGGSDNDPDTYELTFTNITIDNSNKISALWGSWDVACGGLVGMFRGAGHVYMTNCHVASQIDVYNDVCGNYQYYWYRYSGMMVGTNKNMTTDANGYTVPETNKFHAENCTVHFGDWNDYYYCELVANSLASYTHDHQFSRLEQIQNISEIQDENGNWTKTGNFILMNDDRNTCYHIVKNADGTLKQHLHTDAGQETVNGETVLKENNQCVYLPFNQLFTGYGWGVKHIPVYNGENYVFEGITILDREVANSVEKFKGNEVADLYTNTEIKLSYIFSSANSAVEIVPGALTVTVTNLDEGNPVSAEFERDTTNWENGTLTFNGTGKVTITIQDYYFCTPATITVNITERQAAEKFEKKFDKDFLYRVGNVNTVKLDSLFKAKDGAEIGKVSVQIETVGNTGASGTYTSNDTWTNGTIQFSGTGVVKLTIQDDDTYCTPTELYLEVVDATNVTTATNATEKNVVLLNDISASSLTISQGYAFYGNQFTVTFTGDGSYKSAALSYGFVTVENGGILDNVHIKCKIFPYSYLYTNQMVENTSGRYPYGYSAVVIKGDSVVSNCHIYGARNNIMISDGNARVENTITECASVANIHINSGAGNTITLENVTTIQYLVKDDFDVGNNMIGFGILVGTTESESYPTIKIVGDLNQYNWVTESTKNDVTDDTTKQAIAGALDVSDYAHKNTDGEKTVNMGVAFLRDSDTLPATDVINDDDSNMKDIYQCGSIRIGLNEGQVYSIKTDSGITPPANNEIEIIMPDNREILPKINYGGDESFINYEYSFDDNVDKWINKVNVDLDNAEGGSYTFSFNKLYVQKYGKDLEYTVEDENGNIVEEVPLEQLFEGEYKLIVKDNLIFGANGENTGKTEERTLMLILKATKTSIEPPKFTNAGTATAIRLVEKTGGDWRPAYEALTGVSVTYWSASEEKVKTVDLSTLYNSGTINSNVWTYTCDDYTLTITGGAVHSDGTTITPVVANNTLYFASTNKAFTTGTTSRNIILTYVFTDKNESTTWNRTETVTYSGLDEYDYNTFKNNGTLEEPSTSGSGCFTSDTLITLADGSQKRMDELLETDMVKVFNHETGTYSQVSLLCYVNDGVGEYSVINLQFSDGNITRLIYEHALFDMTLNRYVYISEENYTEFIGHEFAKDDGNGGFENVTLEEAFLTEEIVGCYSIASMYHLNYYINGMLSIPGGIDGLFNYFEYDPISLQYDQEKMNEDIEKYGLYTYEDFAEHMTEEIYNTIIPAKYLKVAVGKEMITFEGILELFYMYLA